MSKKILNVIFSIVLGLFIGIIVIGTLIHLLFYVVFGWGDSGPLWGVVIETLMIIGVTISSIYYSLKWTAGPKQR